MRVSHLMAALVCVAALLGSSGLFADVITLNPDGFQSDVIASAFVGGVGPQAQSLNPVNSLPYTTPATETDGSATSTTTPNLSDAGLSATFSQSITDPRSSTGGGIFIYFTANAALDYSIAGTLKAVGDDVEGQLNCTLFDETSDSILYNSYLSFDDLQTQTGVSPADGIIQDTNSLNLDSTGGPLTGALTVGDSYEFLLSEEMDNGGTDPTLTGSGGLTLTAVGGGSSVPLPRSAPAAMGLLLFAALGVRSFSRKLAKQ